MTFRHRPRPRAQRGAILIVGLIVLMLITVMVTAAFKFSTSNLKSVSNMQVRNEAIAAANRSIEEAMDLWTFDVVPTHDPFNVDIDRNGSTDYIVTVDGAVCKGAIPMKVPDKGGDEVVYDLSGGSTSGSSGSSAVFNVTWDVKMTATATATGAKVQMHQGVSRTISQARCDAACPPGPSLQCI